MAPYAPPALATLRDLPDAPTPALETFSPRRTLTHAALRAHVRAFQRVLRARVAPRAVVALVAPNAPPFVAAFLALAAANNVVAPLNPAYTVPEFAFFLADAAAVLVLVPDDVPADAPLRVAAAAAAIPVCSLPNLDVPPPPLEEQAEDDDHDDDERVPRPESVALFLHTSGTTSRPKGVPLTHANLVTSIANIARTYELTSADRCVLVMPLFHVHGLMAATLATLATGGTVVFPPGAKFSASSFWPTVVDSAATWYTAVPTIHQILLARAATDYPADAPPALRFIRSCSASLAPAVLERLEATFHAPVLEAYAMTEAAHQMTSNPLPKHGARKPGSVGLPQNVSVAILDESNKRVADTVVGEVCIRGDNVTAGYQNNPKANEEAFAGGWFHTGDQGFLEGGYVTLTGRLKELINRGGEKISPLEVDAALLAHPAVAEAVSFAAPDPKYGEEVNAAVILKDGVADIGADDIAAFAKTKLAAFKVPKRIFLSDHLPKTATGKIQRRIVSQHFLGKKRSEST